MIKIQNLVCGYSTAVCSYSGEFVFKQGCCYAIVGRNGSGKSTFLRTISGLLVQMEGSIFLDGSVLDKMTISSKAKALAFCSTSRTQVPFLSVRDYIYLGGGLQAKRDPDLAVQVATDCACSNLLEREVQSLSDGQYKKVKLAKALYQNTHSLCVDEPTAHIDPPGRRVIFQLLQSIAHQKNKAVIIATHEIDLAIEYADEVLTIDDKGLISLLPSQEAAAQQAINQLFYEE